MQRVVSWKEQHQSFLYIVENRQKLSSHNMQAVKTRKYKFGSYAVHCILHCGTAMMDFVLYWSQDLIFPAATTSLTQCYQDSTSRVSHHHFNHHFKSQWIKTHFILLLFWELYYDLNGLHACIMHIYICFKKHNYHVITHIR